MSEPTVLAVWARVIAEDLREQRKDTEALFAEAGIALRTINHDGARIPSKSQAHLLEIAARELGDNCYGPSPLRKGGDPRRRRPSICRSGVSHPR